MASTAEYVVFYYHDVNSDRIRNLEKYIQFMSRRVIRCHFKSETLSAQFFLLLKKNKTPRSAGCICIMIILTIIKGCLLVIALIGLNILDQGPNYNGRFHFNYAHNIKNILLKLGHSVL